MKRTIKKPQTVKKKNLFQHLNQVTTTQKPNYWDTLSVEDKKTWSNYMIHRFLSMKMEWVEVVNELQKYKLQPKDLYKLYINVLPKGKQFLKYTKRRDQMDYPNWEINVIRNHLECSRVEATEALDMYMLTEGGMLEIREILVKWGIDEAKIEELGLNDEISLVVSGGIRNGADMAKALALGADAVAIGQAAMIALNCNRELPGITNFVKEIAELNGNI